jgi:hypothetical protein
MMLTARRIPEPEPIAPMKSAKIVKIPTHIPPTQAATGIYLCKTAVWKLAKNQNFKKVGKIDNYHRFVSDSDESHILFSELFNFVFGGFTRNLDPDLREESTGSQNKHGVNQHMKRVFHDLPHVLRRWNVISQT